MGVSKNRVTLKWMVYNGKPYWNGWFGVKTPIFGNTQIYQGAFTILARLVAIPAPKPSEPQVGIGPIGLAKGVRSLGNLSFKWWTILHRYIITCRYDMMYIYTVICGYIPIYVMYLSWYVMYTIQLKSILQRRNQQRHGTCTVDQWQLQLVTHPLGFWHSPC